MNIEQKALIAGMARLMSQESTLLHAQTHQESGGEEPQVFLALFVLQQG